MVDLQKMRMACSSAYFSFLFPLPSFFVHARELGKEQGQCCCLGSRMRLVSVLGLMQAVV